jgi:REP element-mobilizing transposase RayT
VTKHTPVHVTVRVAEGLPNLRTAEVRKVVLAALAAGKLSDGFGLVQYSIQSNHLHLLIEAASSPALARGMKALNTRLARAINRWRGAKGKVFVDRYHVHVLTTPREVRHALAYVLCNFRKHARAVSKVALDPCSSALSFDGWKTPVVAVVTDATAVVAAKSWVLTTGWRRHGLIDPLQVPSCEDTLRTSRKKRPVKKDRR